MLQTTNGSTTESPSVSDCTKQSSSPATTPAPAGSKEQVLEALLHKTYDLLSDAACLAEVLDVVVEISDDIDIKGNSLVAGVPALSRLCKKTAADLRDGIESLGDDIRDEIRDYLRSKVTRSIEAN